MTDEDVIPSPPRPRKRMWERVGRMGDPPDHGGIML